MGIRLSVLASGLAAVATVAGACTIFDGLTATTCSAGATGYLSLSQAARACNYIMNCDNAGQFMGDIESSIGVVTSASSFAYCMNALAGTIPPARPGNDVASAALGCVASAPSCAAARACMGVESIEPSTDPRCAAAAHVPDSGVYCANSGNDIVDCTDAGGLVEHCAAPPYSGNGQCTIQPDNPGNYFCGDNQGGGAACGGCDIGSSLLTTCTSGTTLEGYVLCAALGQTCGNVTFPDDAGDADGGSVAGECLTQGAYHFCDETTFPDQCIDGAVSTCNIQGTISPTDCTATGQKCVQGDQPYCTSPSAACNPYTPGIGTCQGSVVSLCIDGKHVGFDCRCAGMQCKGGACAPH